MKRVVLDTNVVISALLFAESRVSWLRDAWQMGSLAPIVCKATVTELMRVLQYPKFKLSAEEQRELLANFLPYAETALLPSKAPRLPECRDPHDQVFLILSHSSKADFLVTGDHDLLALRDVFQPRIITPNELRKILGSG